MQREELFMDTELKDKTYLSDIIGDSFKTWKPRDIITIKASTGSGKTHFCLHDYLKYVYEKNMPSTSPFIPSQNKKVQKVLYLVNRKILKQQIQEEIASISNDVRINSNLFPICSISSIITVDTYQNIEEKLSSSVFYLLNELQQYDIVIYDEAHYFYSDSNFNTYTSLSYDYLRYTFQKKIQIFISATLNNIEPLIRKYKPYIDLSIDALRPHYLKPYESEKCYSYVNLNVFEDKNDIINFIINNNESKSEKWLIFVDNKEYGKKLKEQLTPKGNLNNISTSDVIYIDAEYQNNEEASSAVNILTKDNYINKKIIITTAVMDNGISFHDNNLRNIVIFSDTEEEFIQMLGRKREDGKKINIYVYLYNAEHFRRRLTSIQSKINAYNFCNNQISSMYKTQRTSPGLQYYQSYTPELTYLSPIESFIEKIPVYPYNQQIVLKKMIADNLFYENCKSFIYSFNGLLAINQFSVERLIKLNEFYESMKKQLETNPYAFLNQICQWLGFSSEEEKKYHMINFVNNKREKLQKIIDSFTKNELSRDDNIELKKATYDELKYLVTIDNFEKKVIDNDLGRKDHPYKPDHFNKLMELLNLPYTMYSTKRGSVKITSKNSNS